MILTFTHSNRSLTADLSKPLDISISVHRDHSISSFGISGAVYKDYVAGDLIGNKALGGPCNLETITFTPHGNSTHTECLGHIANETYFVNDCIHDRFYMAIVWSLSVAEDGLYLNFDAQNIDALKNLDALIIRTLPNSIQKLNEDYSGKNAPAIRTEDMLKIVAMGINHLIIDLPSVDPEWDNGALASHHVYWDYPHNPRIDASITEFAFIRDDIQDGEYLLKLNVSNFESDAAPSRPVLYPIIAIK